MRWRLPFRSSSRSRDWREPRRLFLDLDLDLDLELDLERERERECPLLLDRLAMTFASACGRFAGFAGSCAGCAAAGDFEFSTADFLHCRLGCLLLFLLFELLISLVTSLESASELADLACFVFELFVDLLRGSSKSLSLENIGQPWYGRTTWLTVDKQNLSRALRSVLFWLTRGGSPVKHQRDFLIGSGLWPANGLPGGSRKLLN